MQHFVICLLPVNPSYDHNQVTVPLGSRSSTVIIFIIQSFSQLLGSETRPDGRDSDMSHCFDDMS